MSLMSFQDYNIINICIFIDLYLDEVYNHYMFSQDLSNKIFFEETLYFVQQPSNMWGVDI